MGLHKLDTKVYFAQKAFIYKGGKVLVLRDPFAQIDGQSGVDFPGGKYRWGKDFEAELRREVGEETGLKIKIGEPFFVWNSENVRMKIKKANVVRVGYICKYAGGKVKLSSEHDGYEWVDEKSYRKWEDKTDDFKALEKYFKLNKGIRSSVG